MHLTLTSISAKYLADVAQVMSCCSAIPLAAATLLIACGARTPNCRPHVKRFFVQVTSGAEFGRMGFDHKHSAGTAWPG